MTTDRTMAREDVAAFASFLYGPHWHGALAEALGRDRDALMQEIGGDAPVRPETARRILALMEDRLEQP